MSTIQYTYTTASPKGNDCCSHEHGTPEGAGSCLGRYQASGGSTGRQFLRRTPAHRRRFKLSEIRRVAGWHAGVFEWRGAELVSQEEYERAQYAQTVARMEGQVRKGRARGPR